MRKIHHVYPKMKKKQKEQEQQRVETFLLNRHVFSIWLNNEDYAVDAILWLCLRKFCVWRRGKEPSDAFLPLTQQIWPLFGIFIIHFSWGSTNVWMTVLTRQLFLACFVIRALNYPDRFTRIFDASGGASSRRAPALFGTVHTNQHVLFGRIRETTALFWLK